MAKQEFSFNGKITHLGDIRSGISQRTNKEWKMQDICITEVDADYPQFLKGTLSAYVINNSNYKVGDNVSAKFELKKNSYNGKDFTVINVGYLFIHHSDKVDNQNNDTRYVSEPTKQSNYNQNNNMTAIDSDNNDLPF